MRVSGSVFYELENGVDLELFFSGCVEAPTYGEPGESDLALEFVSVGGIQFPLEKFSLESVDRMSRYVEANWGD